MERMAVPFTPVLRGAGTHSEQAAEQLNELIHHNAGQGWEYVRLESITSFVPAGCLNFGSSGTTQVVQVAVFERRQEE